MKRFETADSVLSSEAIFTGKAQYPFKGSVAIKDNVIIAVGTNEEIEPHIGESTEHYSFGNQLIMPGFNDVHIHLFLGSLLADSVSLIDAKSEEEAARMVRDFAGTRPDDPWIFGFNWYHVYWKEKKLPHRSTLDRYFPDRPVFLLNDELHGAWVNTLALEKMGIDKNTPDPPFGEIVRDENGDPTGFLYETAMGFAQSAFDSIPHERQSELLKNFQSYAAKLGVTSVSDMLPLPGLQLGNLELYKEFDENEKLTVRINFLAELNEDLLYAKKLREQFNSSKLMFSGLKQFLDGVPTTYTAYLVDPYSDKPGERGNTLIPSDYIQEWILEADREGFRIRLHACGDAAVRLGLDCFQTAQDKNGKRDSRHTIEHIELIHPDDIGRFSELNVIASMQPEHMAAAETYEDNVYPKRFGIDREPFTFPIKTLKEHNTTIAFGSDFPVVGMNPMDEIYRALTRVHNDGKPTGGWNEKEKIELTEALRHYTVDAAYSVFQEDVIGTLEQGKLADIVIIDRNLFDIPVEEITKAEVILTMMDGKVIYKNKTKALS